MAKQINMDTEIAAAVKKARPHLMSAWSEAVRQGHIGTFSDWLELAFSDLEAEAAQIAAAVPAGERIQPQFSPWWRRAAQ